jgi:hypothetical protein
MSQWVLVQETKYFYPTPLEGGVVAIFVMQLVIMLWWALAQKMK